MREQRTIWPRFRVALGLGSFLCSGCVPHLPANPSSGSAPERRFLANTNTFSAVMPRTCGTGHTQHTYGRHGNQQLGSQTMLKLKGLLSDPTCMRVLCASGQACDCAAERRPIARWGKPSTPTSGTVPVHLLPKPLRCVKCVKIRKPFSGSIPAKLFKWIPSFSNALMRSKPLGSMPAKLFLCKPNSNSKLKAAILSGKLPLNQLLAITKVTVPVILCLSSLGSSLVLRHGSTARAPNPVLAQKSQDYGVQTFTSIWPY
eukprot:113349-Amphidinium_carterae.1